MKSYQIIKEECTVLGSKMSYIIKNKRYKKGQIYLAVILFIVICIMAYIKVEAFIEEQNHEKWVKQKEQEFKPVIDLVYSVMKGERRVPETSPSPLSRYDISRYADYQDACRFEVDIEVIDVEEISADKKYIIKVLYSQELTGKYGELVGGSVSDSSWTVEKGKDGMWEIVDIDELA